MEELACCSRDEPIGAEFKNFFTDPKLAEVAIKHGLKEKKINDYELTALSRDGKKTKVSFHASAFYDRNRTLQGVFASARFITKRKSMEPVLLG